MAPNLLRVIARIVHDDTGAPMNDPSHRVHFYDLDLMASDSLGESGLSPDGVAEVVCSPASFQAGLLGRLFDRLREKKPDIYIEVVDAAGLPVFRSSVQWNVDAAKVNEVTGMPERTVDLGTYRFRKGEGVMQPFLDRPIGRGPMI